MKNNHVHSIAEHGALEGESNIGEGSTSSRGSNGSNGSVDTKPRPLPRMEHTSERHINRHRGGVVSGEYSSVDQSEVPSTQLGDAYVYYAEGSERHTRRRPTWFHFIPRLCRLDHDPTEASGMAMDMFARATIFMASIFLGPGLLELATDAAVEKCLTNGLDYMDCDALKMDGSLRVHGFKPSSLLTNIAIVAGLVATIVLPLFGAMVDHTPYRRPVGAYSAYGLSFIKALETVGLWSSPSTWWFPVAVMQVGSSILYNCHTVAVYAYSSELDPTNDVSKQSYYQSYFFFVMYVSMLLYLILVLAICPYLPTSLTISSASNGSDSNKDITTAVLSVLLSTLVSFPLFYIAWRCLFPDRPARHAGQHVHVTAPSHEEESPTRLDFPSTDAAPASATGPTTNQTLSWNLFLVGWTQLWMTCRELNSERPQVVWFLGSIMWSEAADSALSTIASTFMKETLRMSSMEIGLVILIDLIAGIPGTWIGNALTARTNNPITSAQWSTALYIGVTTLGALTLTPDHKWLCYIYGVGWGMCQGWMHPQHTTIFVSLTAPTTPNDCHDRLVSSPTTSTTTITPTGSPPSPPSSLPPPVAEYMGLFLFACQILNFFPPLVFTILNETGLDMLWGLASLNLFFGIGLVGLIYLGRMNGSSGYANTTIMDREHQQQRRPTSDNATLHRQVDITDDDDDDDDDDDGGADNDNIGMVSLGVLG